MDKDLLHKIFVSLGGIKQELYAKSFQVNDRRENLPPHVENARRKPQTCRDLSRDLQRLEVRGKLESKTLYSDLSFRHWMSWQFRLCVFIEFADQAIPKTLGVIF